MFLLFRYLFIAAGIHFTLGFQPSDTFYTPLPLYHTAGGIMSMGQAIIFGCTVAIRKKFSASGYFADCVKFNATVSNLANFAFLKRLKLNIISTF